MTPHRDPSWQTAKGCDGPGFFAWLEVHHLVEPLRRDESFARRLWEYRNGGVADFYVVDKMLTRLGYHVQDVPDELWLDRNRRGSGEVTADRKLRLDRRAAYKRERKCVA